LGPAFVGFYGGRRLGRWIGFGFGGEFAGSRLDSANRSARGIATALDTDGTSTFTTRTFGNVNVINGRGNFNYAYAHNARAVTVTSHNNFVGGGAVNRGAFT